MITADFSTIDGACGIGVVHDFSRRLYNKDYYGKKYPLTPITLGTKGGCGYLSAGFIKDNSLCDEAFKLLSEKYKVVFVSECRVNKNSRNPFYFAIFDTEGTYVPTGYDHFDEAWDEYCAEWKES